jgi:tetratricopeptide (TPR) repeat protein
MSKSWFALWIILALGPGAASAAERVDEAVEARELFQRGDLLAALPLYERLMAADPSNSVYAERLTVCLYAAMEVLPEGKERDALIARALQQAERAKALGDNSVLLLQILDRLHSPDVHQLNPEQEMLREAEAAFSRGDFDNALAGYKAAAAKNPGSYLAHLYAGDVYFSKGDLASAAEWFGKAIAIDPDTETAYRYWADAIVKAGDQQAALPYYIKAVVAEPYKRNTWAALQGWANRNGVRMQAPQLPRPQVALQDDGTGKGPQPGINVNADMMSDKRSGAAWLAYATNRIIWIKEKYLERHPGESEYRHSLDEEVESLRFALKIIDKDLQQAAALPALQDLVRLSGDNMLEPYVLFNAADEGIAQDYAAYRAGHREQLARYIDQYLLVRPASGK